ncbi:MAG: type I-U CRISPR-associated RAMP protein Csb1/Cas7u [Pirellulaceae bacterium]|nr:type I-U CRISPR-associated protein Cas7 [Planctomycetales bacterium]
MSQPDQFTDFTSLLKSDGPIALVIKQELAPDDEDERTIFPPTYPMTFFKGRVQRFEHGVYRVSVELPPDTKREKDEKKDNQKPGYQIDRFSDDENLCEIDSIQSQSNRIEPQFKTIRDGKLVPQITIDVKDETVNLLDAGHRAADAVVRMSSLAPDFHDAWTAANKGDLFPMATLAPTTIVFGAWDSRSTQAKLKRLMKAHIRATNVRERTRSAQYTPAADYVGLGAIGEDVSQGEDEKNNLSQEGMKHALSTQTVGGVVLTADSRLTRTVNVNLAAIRKLRASARTAPVAEDADEDDKDAARKEKLQLEEEKTRVLREYILGLTLVAAYSTPDLDLREGCNLQVKDQQQVTVFVQDRREHVHEIRVSAVEAFAEHAAKQFFEVANVDFGDKDHHGVFESGVAEKFLSMPTADRDKVRRLGPVTQVTLARFASMGKDPLKAVTDELNAVKKAIGNKPRGKNAQPIVNIAAFQSTAVLLEELAADDTLPDGMSPLVGELADKAKAHDDSHEAHKTIVDKIKEFKKAMKKSESTEASK